jgi:hypothetical protein
MKDLSFVIGLTIGKMDPPKKRINVFNKQPLIKHMVSYKDQEPTPKHFWFCCKEPLWLAHHPKKKKKTWNIGLHAHNIVIMKME